MSSSAKGKANVRLILKTNEGIEATLAVIVAKMKNNEDFRLLDGEQKLKLIGESI
jgi:hypothetical protein